MSTINLLPEDYLQRRCQKRSNVMCIALFVIIMVGIGAATLVSGGMDRRMCQERDSVNAAYADARTELARLKNLQDQKRRTVARAKSTSELIERVPRSYVLAVLTNALPENAALSQIGLRPSRRKVLVQTPKVTKFEGATAVQTQTMIEQRVVIVEVTGIAATDVEVAQFMNRLLHDPLLDTVELGYSQEVTIPRATPKGVDIQARQFRITMEIKPGIDVIDILGNQQTKTAMAGLGGANL